MDRGFVGMFEDGAHKAALGLTTMAEVYRVIGIPEPEPSDDLVLSAYSQAAS
jgi:hypothetical protein